MTLFPKSEHDITRKHARKKACFLKKCHACVTLGLKCLLISVHGRKKGFFMRTALKHAVKAINSRSCEPDTHAAGVMQ